jgi:hypothetical protein
MQKDFDNELEANKFRDAKRQEGLAASRFDYGNNRYRVKVWTPIESFSLSRMQSSLSSKAWEMSNDIETLSKIKQIMETSHLIDGSNVEEMVLVARWLNKNHWFHYPEEVINFFEGITEETQEKIKVWMNDSLQEYEDQWNDKEDWQNADTL